MKQEFQAYIKDDDTTNQIEYSCFYNKCKFCSSLCKFCKLDVNHQHKTHIANKEEYFQQQQIIKQSIRNAKFERFLYGNQIKGIFGAISNDLKYVAIGGKDLYIWDHSNNNLIKTIQIKNHIIQVKFTNDSKIIYVTTYDRTLYKFNVNNQFKQEKTYQLRYDKNFGFIRNIYCISNEILLTSTSGGYIRKINVSQKKQLLKIKAHSDHIPGLDYNKSLNLIVSGSQDQSISFWNANDGQLLFKESLAHGRSAIEKVLFMNNDQLISQDGDSKVIIWKIDYQTKRLYKLQYLDSFHSNIQIVLHQQFIISNSRQSVNIYSIDGKLIREFIHNFNYTCIKHNTYFFKFQIVLIQFNQIACNHVQYLKWVTLTLDYIS